MFLTIESDLNFILAILYCILESWGFCLGFCRSIRDLKHYSFPSLLSLTILNPLLLFLLLEFGTINVEIKSEVCILEDLH